MHKPHLEGFWVCDRCSGLFIREFAKRNLGFPTLCLSKPLLILGIRVSILGPLSPPSEVLEPNRSHHLIPILMPYLSAQPTAPGTAGLRNRESQVLLNLSSFQPLDPSSFMWSTQQRLTPVPPGED